MLCQKCGLTTATVHRESVVFRQKIEEHLCELCAGVGAEVLRPRRQVVRADAARRSGMAEPVDAIPWPLEKLLQSPHRVEIPYGLAALPTAVQRLFDSKEPNAGLMVSTLPGRMLAIVGMTRVQGDTELELTLTQYNPPNTETIVQQFFTAQSISLKYAFGSIEVTRCRRLHYTAPGNCETVANLVAELLKVCFSVLESDPLNFWVVKA